MRTVLVLMIAGWLTTASSWVAAELPRLALPLGDELFQLELVDDPVSRQQGLMGRGSLDTNGGMLFDFPAGTRPAIWMRNMLISLDLLFVDDQGQLVQIFEQVPPCQAMPCPIYRAEQPLRFVIELAAGSAERLGLQPGAQLELGELTLRPAPPQ